MSSTSMVNKASIVAANDAALQQTGAWRPAIGLAVTSLLVMGLAYAVATTAIARVPFPAQADGSLMLRDGVVVGSSLVAQPFVGAGYFQPRPSAASYDPMAAAGSNMARSNPALQQRVVEAIAGVSARESVPASAVPSDLVTQSGSGLDPEISPAAAAIQVARVARARGMEPGAVEQLVRSHTRQPLLGVIGQPGVNVVTLNLALDTLQAAQ